jgi:hypothetical protein
VRGGLKLVLHLLTTLSKKRGVLRSMRTKSLTYSRMMVFRIILPVLDFKNVYLFQA